MSFCLVQQDGRLWKVETGENPFEIFLCLAMCFLYHLFSLLQVEQVDLRTMDYTSPWLIMFVSLSSKRCSG